MNDMTPLEKRANMAAVVVPFLATLAAIGSMAVQGPVMAWVADHRKHHAHADEEGDPHSPHVGHGDGVSGVLRGLWHAHTGWLFSTQGRASSRRYETEDHSTNVAWLAIPSFGEAWHHNHHAFPRSASHGLRRWERAMDPSALVIKGLEKVGLARNVVTIGPERQLQRERTAAPLRRAHLEDELPGGAPAVEQLERVGR